MHNPEHLIGIAESHFHKNDLLSAEKSAKKALVLDRKSIRALLVLGKISAEKSNYQKALEIINQAHNLNRDDLKVYDLWAKVLHSQGETQKAIQKLELAKNKSLDPIPWQIKIAELSTKSVPSAGHSNSIDQLAMQYPERADVLSALSKTFADKGELQEANNSAKTAIKHVQQLPLLDQAELYIHAAILNKQMGQLDQALHDLDSASKLADNLLEIHLERGRIYASRRQQNEAIKAFEKAAKVAPDNPEAHLQIASLHKTAKNYKGAEIALRRAVELAPQNRNIQKQLAALIALNFVHKSESIGVES
jgi:tetratricopeptide (TPR) repeat protein